MKIETTEVSLRYVIFDPEQHIPGLCAQHLPSERLRAAAHANGYTPEELGDTWQSVPHNEIRPERPELAHCTAPSYRHGVVMRHEATGEECGVIICPGDRVYLDRDNEPWAASDGDGKNVRLLSNGGGLA